MLSPGSKMAEKGTRFVDIKGSSYKLWWSGNNHRIVCVGILVKEEFGKKIVKVRRKSGKVMAMVLVFEEKVVYVICAYALPIIRL